jgi:phosphoribosylformylglycinamidine synthase
MKVNVLILRAPGTNCDKETAFAFQVAGASFSIIHVSEIIKRKSMIEKFKIFVIPGGFSYGDDVSAGRILANELKQKLKEELIKFINSGRIVIGICNGFQVLIELGILPFSKDMKRQAALITNDSGKFEDRWVYLKVTNRSIFTKGLDIIYLPVAHMEGKFYAEKKVLEKIERNNQIIFKYVNEKGNFAGYPYNPNGALLNIAGITNETGNVLGMMPHPERYIFKYQHPRWQRENLPYIGDGLRIIKNVVNYAKKNL